MHGVPSIVLVTAVLPLDEVLNILSGTTSLQKSFDLVGLILGSKVEIDVLSFFDRRNRLNRTTKVEILRSIWG